MQRLSALDAVILDAETPVQPLSVLAVLVTAPDEAPLGFRGVHARISERYGLVPQMRRRLQRLPMGHPAWVDDGQVRVDDHLHHTVLDPPGDERRFGALVGEIAAQPLPHDRPLWEAWYVEGLADGAEAVVAKIHHCAVDGVAGIGALAAFFDLEPNPPPTPLPAWDAEPPPDVGTLGRAAVTGAWQWAAEAPRAAAQLVRAGRTFLGAGRSDAGAPLPFSGPRLSINGALTQRREVALATVALDDVKHVRRPLGVTVNDVVLAICAGALRTYLGRRGDLPDRPIVAAIPASEQPLGDDGSGNHISAMFCALPVDVDDPLERVLAVQRSAAGAKEQHQRLGEGALGRLAGIAPPGSLWAGVRAAALGRMGDRLPPLANVVVSNVRGPEFPLFVAGARLQHLYPLGPLLEGVGLNVTVASYRDEIAFGFLACPDLVDDVAELAATVPAALAQLLEVAARLDA
jgi:diacylglycerol O-acyltransferase / wax synthase